MVRSHPFQDITSIPSDVAITTAATTVDISATSNILQIVTARLVETSGERNTRLWLKHRQWWDEHIIEPDDQQRVYTHDTPTEEEYPLPLDFLDVPVVGKLRGRRCVGTKKSDSPSDSNVRTDFVTEPLEHDDRI